MVKIPNGSWAAAAMAASLVVVVAGSAVRAETTLRFAEPVHLLGAGGFTYDVDLISAPESTSGMALQVTTRQARPPHEINFTFASEQWVIDLAALTSQENMQLLGELLVGGRPPGVTLGFRPEAGQSSFTLDLLLQSPLSAGQTVDVTFDTQYSSSPGGFMQTLSQRVALVGVDNVQQITRDAASDDILTGRAAELLSGRTLELLDDKTTDKLSTLPASLLKLKEGQKHRLKDPRQLKGDVKIEKDARLILEKLQQVKLLGGLEIDGGTLVAPSGVQIGSDAAVRAAQAALQEESLEEGTPGYQDALDKWERLLDQYRDQFDPNSPPTSPEELQQLLQDQQQMIQLLSNLSKALHDTAKSIIRKIGSRVEGDLRLAENLSVGEIGQADAFEVIGDFTVESSGRLQFDLGGVLAGEYDAIDVDGSFTMETGALLQVLLAGSPTPFEPQAGDVFDLVVADEIELKPIVLDAPVIDGALLSVFVAEAGGRQTLRLGVLAVPEPATATLALALAPLAGVLRQRLGRRGRVGAGALA